MKKKSFRIVGVIICAITVVSAICNFFLHLPYSKLIFGISSIAMSIVLLINIIIEIKSKKNK